MITQTKNDNSLGVLHTSNSFLSSLIDVCDSIVSIHVQECTTRNWAFHSIPREFLYLVFREDWEGAVVFMAKSKQKSQEKKSRLSEEKKATAMTISGENKQLSRRQSITEESTQLSQNVKNINKKMEHDGEVMFFDRLPQKIIELTEYLKVQLPVRLNA